MMVALFFAKNWLGMAIGAAIAVALCAIPYTLAIHARDMARAEANVAEAARAAAEQRVETLKVSIARQNEAIEAMHRESDAREAHINEVVKTRLAMLEAERKAIQKAAPGHAEMNRWLGEVLR